MTFFFQQCFDAGVTGCEQRALLQSLHYYRYIHVELKDKDFLLLKYFTRMVIHKGVVKNLFSPFRNELICINTSNWYVLTLFAGYSGGINTFSKSKKKISFCHLCSAYMMFQCLKIVKQWREGNISPMWLVIFSLNWLMIKMIKLLPSQESKYWKSW